MADAQENRRDWARPVLAIGMTVVSVGAVITLGAISIARDHATAEHVLSITLPLLGTWVGTVLAYYFSRENFESASRSVERMAKQMTSSEKLASLAVTDRMIRHDPATLFSKREPTSGIKLKQLLAELDPKNQKGRVLRRVPIFDSTGKVARCVVHRSLIEGFLLDQAISGKTGPAIEALSLEDLLNDVERKRVAGSFAVVGENATLADAKQAMEDQGTDCQDVFVTKGAANRSGEVLGWITNVIIASESTV